MKKIKMQNRNDSQSWIKYIYILLIIIPLLFIIFSIVVIVPIMGGFSIPDFWTNKENVQQLIPRSPHIYQAIGNLLLYLIACICGIILYSKHFKRTKKEYLVLAIVSGLSAIFLHTMVWGIDLFIPSNYSLLSTNNRSLMFFGALQTNLYGNGIFIDNLVSFIIHIFAPQVLTAASVSILSIIGYKKAGKKIVK